MRKSEAPSLKTKFCLSTSRKNKNLNNLPTSDLENSFEVVRSTESVLNLLLNSDDTVTDNKTVEQELNYQNEKISKISNSNVVPKTDSENSCQKSELPLLVYNVVYGKQNKKKHKTWEGDGTLEIGSKYLTLKNDDGKVIGTVPCSKARKLEEGERIYIGCKEVELIDLADEKFHKLAKKNENGNLSKNLNNETILKINSKNYEKKFVYPALNFSSGIPLPEPNYQHQWHFNQKALPISPVYIEASLSKKLREHQCAGIFFLYECVMGFREKNLTGAILADEMGLGKTLQCIALIWTLLKQGPYNNKPVVKKVLIVTPSSLTMNWQNEFLKWLGRVKLLPFVVDQKNKPSNMRGPVMIISYEMLVRYFEDVETHNFDLLICDEGHRLKNFNIKTTKLLNSLNCSKRILLTGTPIQNDLQEYFALVDFVNPNILGTPSEFRRRFEEPILASRQPNASEYVLAKGKECAQDLKRITRKFLLRRTRDILKNYLPPRHEIVVFCKITDEQQKLYNFLINSFISDKQNDLVTCDGISHLELIVSLRKISSHPSLLRRENYEKNFPSFNFDNGETPTIEVSSKALITINFLQELRESSPKEKVVLVSNSTQTLDLLGKILNYKGYSTCRLDGSTPAAQRNKLVERFNLSYSSSFVFLLSAKAGGVGLNLTGASRLLLFDSDWNPATDLQAIARIWRDGQKYPVFIYRLLTTGTIDEKIYQRQISKQGLSEGTVDPENAKSIKLSKEELKDIFSPCFLKEDCLTHKALLCNCSKQGEIPIPELETDERNCQLMKQPNSSLKISELFHWEHHGSPFNAEFLSKLCLKKSEKDISFIFRSCKN